MSKTKKVETKKYEGYASDLTKWLQERNARVAVEYRVTPKGLFSKLVFRFLNLEIKSRVVLLPK